MPDDDEVGMETDEFEPEFKTTVLANLKGLKEGQDDQAKRITNMHTRQDRVELMLGGTMEEPEKGMVSLVKANTKFRRGTWKWVTGVCSAVAIAVLTAWAIGGITFGK